MKKRLQKICNFLNIKHIFVEINNQKIKNICKTKSFKNLLKNSEQGLSILDTTEYVALNELKKKKKFSRTKL